MSNAVDLADVSFSYGDRPAVTDVTFNVPIGDFLGLVGPNGSGKTTLLKLMLGLLTPDTGRIELFGEPVETFDDGERIGYVSQRAAGRNQTMPVTVEEVVRMGRYPHIRFGRFSRTDRRTVSRALETVGIESLADRRIGELSGGQRQRVFIARALASEADLLALDEPTVGVDAESRDAFYALLDSLNDRGITIVLIEHDIGVVTEHVDHVVCINREVYHHGDPASFAQSDALARAYGNSGNVVEHHH